MCVRVICTRMRIVSGLPLRAVARSCWRRAPFGDRTQSMQTMVRIVLLFPSVLSISFFKGIENNLFFFFAILALLEFLTFSRWFSSLKKGSKITLVKVLPITRWSHLDACPDYSHIHSPQTHTPSTSSPSDIIINHIRATTTRSAPYPHQAPHPQPHHIHNTSTSTPTPTTTNPTFKSEATVLIDLMAVAERNFVVDCRPAISYGSLVVALDVVRFFANDWAALLETEGRLQVGTLPDVRPRCFFHSA